MCSFLFSSQFPLARSTVFFSIPFPLIIGPIRLTPLHDCNQKCYVFLYSVQNLFVTLFCQPILFASFSSVSSSIYSSLSSPNSTFHIRTMEHSPVPLSTPNKFFLIKRFLSHSNYCLYFKFTFPVCSITHISVLLNLNYVL